MRLTCPNCGAQYEIPAEVIPAAGRDVQCSNCSDTWYQPHPDSEPSIEDESLQAHFERRDSELQEDVAEPEPELVEDIPEKAEDLDTSVGDGDSWEPAAISEEQRHDADKVPDPVEDDEDEASHSVEIEDDTTEEPEPKPLEASQTLPPARELDSSIARILREEAEREQEVRRQEANSGLEVQADLGLEQAHTEEPKEQTRIRIDQMRGRSEEALEEQEAPARRDLLPDIEEISSSLRGEEELAPSPSNDVAPSGEKTSGFRTGFLLAVLVFVTAAVIYITASDIIRTIPSLESPLTSYVEMVDAGRLQLEGQFNKLKDWLNHMSQPPAE